MKHLRFWQKMAVGFGLVIALMMIGGKVAWDTSNNLSDLTHKLYRHPLAVGTSIRDIQTELVAIHRSMKDVAMSETLEQMTENQKKVGRNTENALAHFAVLNERFLGDKKDIVLAEELFRDWAPIRNKVIEQRRIQIENDANEITRTEGGPHVAKIIKAMDDLIEFAKGKAAEFYEKSQNAAGANAAELVEKFYRHPFTVATTSVEVQMDTFKILKMMKDLSVAKTPEAVTALADEVNALIPEIMDDFALIKERFLGDKSMILSAEKLFVDWQPIRDKVIGMRLAQVTANPREITIKEGAPHLAKLIGVLDNIRTFADNKAVEFNENAETKAVASNRLLVGLFSGAAVIALLMAFVVTRGVTKPLNEAVQMAEQVAAGDLTRTSEIDQRDEIGQLIKSLNTMTGNLRTMFIEIATGTRTLTASSSELSAASEQISASSDRTAERSVSVAGAAEEMSTNMGSVAAATEQTTANIQMIVSAAEEMTATINEIANNTAKGSETTGNAVARAREISAQVSLLGDAAAEISKVTDTIADISEQTNLLALNATIEASRAGEAGKGFAVVAGEIKNLALQTAEATSEISTRISGVQEKTTQSVAAITSIVEVINEINDIMATVATAIEEQSATTREISQNVSQAAAGVQEVNENVNQTSLVAGEVTRDITGVSEAGEEVKNGSQQVYGQAGELLSLAQNLNEMVSRFRVN